MNIRFPNQLKDRLKVYATSEGSTMNGVVCEALTVFLDIQQKGGYEPRSVALGKSRGFENARDLIINRLHEIRHKEKSLSAFEELEWLKREMNFRAKHIKGEVESIRPAFINAVVIE